MSIISLLSPSSSLLNYPRALWLNCRITCTLNTSLFLWPGAMGFWATRVSQYQNIQVNQQPSFNAQNIYLHPVVIESHPEEPGDDLRLYEPFPALQKFCESINVESLDSHHHGHTPYVVLLIQELLKWRAQVLAIFLSSFLLFFFICVSLFLCGPLSAYC